MPRPYPIPASEPARLQALADYHVIDTPPEEEFDRLVGLASRLFDVPIVLISLIDAERQFFKAEFGLGKRETSRELSFCTYAIMQENVLVVPDALADPRFATNALVLNTPFIRFYAGHPLVAPNGEKIGTFCLIDTKPREHFSTENRRDLADMAALVLERLELRRLDTARSISQARFENIAATSPDAIICSDAGGRITFWNRSAERLFGYSAEEIVGRPAKIIVPARWRHFYIAEFDQAPNGHDLDVAARTVEITALRKGGGEFPAEFSFSTWQEGSAASMGAIVRDITDRKQNEERLSRLAALDALTGLANRAAWRAYLDTTLDAGHPCTVILLDLDGFKEVNDTFGHSAGDAVLREVALRMKMIVPTPIALARLGGDEFVILLSGNDEHGVKTIAAELIGEISERYELPDRSVEIGVSVGMAMSPQHGVSAEDLMGAADLALYRAKATGKGQSELFAPALRDLANTRRAFEKELRDAFENREFELFYQPQASTVTRAIKGAEALLRWNNPERGLLSPASFITVLSRKPSASRIGEWILREACRQASQWRRVLPEFRVSVNLFEAQFRSGRLVSSVREALQEYALPPEALELEIVETTSLYNDNRTLKLLRDLRHLGVGLAFDDYGTGYASLSLLKSFPISRLKIDRSFVRSVSTDREDAAVVKAVIYLSRNFGMEVIAEGVETEEQLDFLVQNGCPEAQGYLFGRPLRSAVFEKAFLEPAEVTSG
ncbi:EAL domain-containing protein [Jiella sp. MQZ9-1]|uniref:EAL domain-containing protein n=1 Tax=Jiella flava TaxID=2816857 RepID=A0A939FZA1_9HYPH|nr:EAL domain-containing protein [Jiella flava]MBO0662099.1 EAL domain-containing protein [Jiella flava]MCD2470573.1 EAL domain-containing protein [Jiella flava]